jgi:tight adherence protein B
MAVMLCLFGFLIPGILFERGQKKMKDILILQLRDSLNSITSSLKAGLSLNSAIIKCVDDLERIHTSKKEQFMLNEFMKIRFDLNTGMSVEDALKEFKDRIKIDDAEDFVNSILVVRQKGGNLVEVVDNVTKMINDKIAIRNEINILTAGKKMEARMLTVTPIAMIVLLSLFSSNYMDTMLNSTLGKILIITGFIMLAANYFLGKRIVDINV